VALFSDSSRKGDARAKIVAREEKERSSKTILVESSLFFSKSLDSLSLFFEFWRSPQLLLAASQPASHQFQSTALQPSVLPYQSVSWIL
jgi:hypothetical protein